MAALSSNIPPELLGLATSLKIFSPTQSLLFAEQINNQDQKAAAIAKIAPFLGDLNASALAMARKFQSEEALVIALNGLAPHFHGGRWSGRVEVLGRDPIALAPRGIHFSVILGCVTLSIISRAWGRLFR